MKQFKEDEVVIMMFSHQSVIGRFVKYDAEGRYFIIKNPRIITTSEGDNPAPQMKSKFYGNPEEVVFRENDAIVMYEVGDKSVETMYFKEVTGLSLASEVVQ